MFLFFFFLLLTVSKPAYAYLDPGSGNALIYVFVSLTGAFFYVVKSLFYRLVGKEVEQAEPDDGKKLVIFGENGNYWPVFKTTAERLTERKIRFYYLTTDIDDPALMVESDYMQPRYIGDGAGAYYKMSHLSADILYTTTPNIGTAGYPIARSPNVKKIVFVGHVFGTIECVWLRKFACDKYDEIIASNDTVEERVRHLEKIRHLPEKKVCVCGCPYLDVLNDRLKNVSTQTDGKTVLIGSSWGDKGCLNVYGTDFIERLAKAGYNVIVRPHPQSLISEKEMIRKYREKLKKYENVSWSFDVDGIPAMAKSDVMISDVSGVRFDYFALLQRPVLVLEMPEIDLDAYDYGDLREIMAKFRPEEEMGAVLPKDKIDRIEDVVAGLIKNQKNRNYQEIRDKYAFNFGRAGRVIADHLISEMNE